MFPRGKLEKFEVLANNLRDFRGVVVFSRDCGSSSHRYYVVKFRFFGRIRLPFRAHHVFNKLRQHSDSTALILGRGQSVGVL